MKYAIAIETAPGACSEYERKWKRSAAKKRGKKV